jgi:hypothetical protein
MTSRAKWADDVSLIDTMWENYVLIGSTEMLVAYSRAGGDLDPMNDELREMIAAALEGTPIKL